jgi:4-amino-4-deoxy-L-arabinose transferase
MFLLPSLAGLLLLLSLYLFLYRHNTTASLWCLFAGALALRLWMTLLDPFLHEWDERFHALVAKNMVEYPWKPMLRTQPIFPYDFKAWCCNHVWLHKQPLFLWQMALSMKLFGADLWSMRFPSALMGALLIFPIYRIGTILHDSRTGFYAAFLSAGAFWQLDMISGQQSMDHNDMAFLFYVGLSLWAYLEWERQSDRNWKWVIWIGVFAGAAILCKWLTGLLVYSAWGINWLLGASGPRGRELGALLASVGVAVAFFLPWQLYTHHVFPEEAAYELAFASKHLHEVVENHSGNWDFYFNYFKHQYGPGSWLPAVVGLILCVFWANKPAYRNAMLVWIATVYIFFSFIAQTKLSGYVYPVASLIYVLFGLSVRGFERLLELGVSAGVRRIAIAGALIGGGQSRCKWIG